MKKARLIHGVSVPDLRSDGESSSNERTPSSTRSSNPDSNIWTGSLPNLTVQLSAKRGTDPYGTFAENLNHIEAKETISPILIKVINQFEIFL
jgi:hypothetical protein